MKHFFAIIGCGKVGTILGKFLSDSGYKAVGAASKNIDSAKRTAQIIGAETFSKNPLDVVKNADIVFITTPDSIIQTVCDEISKFNGFKKNSFVFHCSGALSSEILLNAKKCQCYTGSIHPLQSFASIETNINPFKDIIMAVEGENEAIDTAQKIVSELEAIFIKIETSSKTLYHTSAVIASNYLVTILDFSYKLMELAGIPKENINKALNPLVMGTLSNIEKIGIPNALTGPIGRGDIETIEKHLNEIDLKFPEFILLYKTLGNYTVPIAEAKRTISESTAKKLVKLFNQ